VRLIFKNARNKEKFLLYLFDLVCILYASLVSYALIIFLRDLSARKLMLDPAFSRFVLLMILLYSLGLYIFELYDIPFKLRKLYTLTSIALIIFLSCVIFLVISGIFNLDMPDARVLFPFFILATGCLFIQRWLFFKYIISPDKKVINVLFVGIDALTEHILNMMKGPGYNVVGVVSGGDPLSNAGERKQGPLNIVNAGKDLEALIGSKEVKILVLALENRMSSDFITKMHKYKLEGIDVYSSDHFYEILSRKFPIEQYLKTGTVPVLNIDSFASPVFKNTKKLIDYFGATVMLLILSPLFLVISVLVKTTSRGPIFYLQERIGFQEKPFKLIKFRTMIVGAEKDNGPQWAKKNDIRTTKIGRILRRTRLDELPQMINVLRGELSFVGPRSIRRHFAEIIEGEVPFYAIRFSVKPGITGWAQVNYHYGGTVEGHVEKFRYDLYYLEHASLLLDLYIILKTLQTLVRRPAF